MNESEGPCREQLEVRLEALKQEFETGQSMLRQAELQRQQLGETLLRISGAIQVLDSDTASREPRQTCPCWTHRPLPLPPQASATPESPPRPGRPAPRDVSAAHARRGRRAGVSQTELPALIMREVAERVGQVDVAVLVGSLCKQSPF